MGYRIHPSVLFTDLEDGTSVLLHLDSKYYYTLNESGTIIWRALMEREGATAGELAQSLATTSFGVDEEVLRPDLDEMFQEMLSEQILLEEQA
jgi:hypothetical protein